MTAGGSSARVATVPPAVAAAVASINNEAVGAATLPTAASTNNDNNNVGTAAAAAAAAANKDNAATIGLGGPPAAVSIAERMKKHLPPNLPPEKNPYNDHWVDPIPPNTCGLCAGVDTAKDRLIQCWTQFPGYDYCNVWYHRGCLGHKDCHKRVLSADWLCKTCARSSENESEEEPAEDCGLFLGYPEKKGANTDAEVDDAEDLNSDDSADEEDEEGDDALDEDFIDDSGDLDYQPQEDEDDNDDDDEEEEQDRKPSAKAIKPKPASRSSVIDDKWSSGEDYDEELPISKRQKKAPPAAKAASTRRLRSSATAADEAESVALSTNADAKRKRRPQGGSKNRKSKYNGAHVEYADNPATIPTEGQRGAGEAPRKPKEQMDNLMRIKLKAMKKPLATLVDSTTPLSRTDEFDPEENSEHKVIWDEQCHWPYAMHGMFHFANQGNNPPGGNGNARRLQTPLLKLYVGSYPNVLILEKAFEQMTMNSEEVPNVRFYSEFDEYCKSFNSKQAKKMSKDYHKKKAAEEKKKKEKED